MSIDKALLERYYRGQCTPAEKQAVEQWLLENGPFEAGQQAHSNNPARLRMWQIIQQQTLQASNQHHPLSPVHPLRKYRRYAAAASVLLALTGGYIWQQCNHMPDAGKYIIVDNTSGSILIRQQIGGLIVSESANSAIHQLRTPGAESLRLFANSLIIDNPQGEDVWVYLKTGSDHNKEMIRFLCKGNSTYVAGYINEHSNGGRRKYLLTPQSIQRHKLSAQMIMRINSQLEAVRTNHTYKSRPTIII